MPVISLAGWSGLGRSAVIEQVSAAAEQWGFFQIVDHGIPLTLIDQTVAQCMRFFSLPSDVKRLALRSQENPWGYYDNELTKNQRDKKEVFDFTNEGADPIFGGRNRWPADDPIFRQTMLDYFAANAQLSMGLLEAFSLGLGMKANGLEKYFSDGDTSFVRLNYYPVDDPLASRDSLEPVTEADLGIHHHTDAGALTVLLQHDVAGLQVHRDEQWHNVATIDGALVVNTGDMMQVWSNGLYKAPIHRVLAMDVEDRISIPFFLNPAAAAQVQPLGSAVNAQRPAMYSPIEWGSFRRQRADGDYADFGSEVQIENYRRA